MHGLYRSPEIETRDDFGELCNRRGLRRYAVEVGTERADFAVAFRKKWHGHLLLCIDPWKDDLEDYDELRWERHSDHAIAMHRLAQLEGVEVFRGTLQEALKVKRFRWPPDFLYIDDNHAYPRIKWNLANLWPLMAPDGIFAGHDFDLYHAGVIRAVSDFGREQGVPIYHTCEPHFKSWYCYRSDKELYYASKAVDPDVRPEPKTPAPAAAPR